jgi:DNA-binding NarL/FixJ family response regulator
MNTLTNQEHKILELVAKGWRNSKIASELFISTKTVETHLHHIFSKLDVSSRTEAAIHFWNTTPPLHLGIHESTDDSANRKA